MVAGDDSSDEDLRRALQGLGGEIGQDALQQVVQLLGAQLSREPQHLGDFRLGRELGRGGMGVVYEAEQVSVPGRTVAVKVLLGFSGSATARQRFAREVAVAGKLDHPHIVPILCADVAGTHPFYAMKKIEGRPLRDLLRDGTLRSDWRRTATMIRDLASALHHAHERGVVHRDVKPGNVVVDGQGHAMLLDFGLAHVLQQDSDLTRSLDAIGTPDYMAPEQVSRQFGPITPRTDVYALGVTLFECLAGRTPFTADSRTETLERIVAGDAERLRTLVPGVPRDLENICAMAMDAEPARRYATAAAFAADLDAFLDFRPVVARPAGWLRRGFVLARRHRLLTAAALAALVTFSAAAGYWAWWQPRQAVHAHLTRVETMVQRDADLDRRISARTAVLDERSARARRPGLDPEAAELQFELQRWSAERAHLRGELESALEACLALDPANRRTHELFADFVAYQLRQALQGAGIVSRRDQVERLQARLQRFDTGGRHDALLARTAGLSVRCARGPAHVWLCAAMEQPDGRILYAPAESRDARDLGTTPLDIEVPEGNYALRASVDGCEPIVLPMLLRRRAVQLPAERDVALAAQTAPEIGAGYRQVHAGFSVLQASPAGAYSPREELRWVDGFAMAEHEVRTVDLEAWFGEVPEFLAKACRGTMLAGPVWPQIAELVHQLNVREQRDATGYCVALPTPEQWTRAGQGADGRPYPWGWLHDWRFTQNYWSSVDDSMALRPTQWPEQDVSPFGIHDLAGSLREVCLPVSPMREVGNKQFLLRGGSHYSFRADDLMLSASRSLMNDELAVDTGVRLVRRPLPNVPPGPAVVRLHHGRPAGNGPSLPDGWHLCAVSGPFLEDLTASDRARAESDHVVVDGFAGNFSPQLMLWHAADLGGDRVRLTTSISLRDGEEATRPIELRLGTQPGFDSHDRWVAAQWMRDRLWVAIGGGGKLATSRGALPPFRKGETHELELTLDARTIRATWRQAGGELVAVEVDRPADLPTKWRYAGVRLPGLPGVRGLQLSVHDFSAGPE